MHKYFMLLLLASCGIDREIPPLSQEEEKKKSAFLSISLGHQLDLVNDDEPGEKLTLCITLINKEGKDLVALRKVHVYHADADGDYEPTVARDESSARLSGDVISDHKGRFVIKTILPGDYGSSDDNRHIHTTVFGAKPEAYDIHFKQYTGMIGTRFVEGSDQHFLADLRRDVDGSLIGFLEIEVKNP